MNAQADLFTQEEPARARRTDPETSKDAARSVHVSLLEMTVVSCLKFVGNSTTSEIARWARIPLVSISPRMKPLEEKGLVQRTTERREHKIVWKLA
jgi:DNA-binding MarR family transcriptional regulator